MAKELILTLLPLSYILLTSLWTTDNNSTALSSTPTPGHLFSSNYTPHLFSIVTNSTCFQENYCCQDNKLQLIFSHIRPLINSSEECNHFLNIFIYYLCSPLQYRFNRSGNLNICLPYCDRMYKTCSRALINDKPVRKLYTNGCDFCLSLGFKINDINNSSLCFSDDDFLTQMNKQIKIGDNNMSSTNIERPNFMKLFIVICLAAMLSFILC